MTQQATARTGPFGHSLDSVVVTEPGEVAAVVAEVAPVARRWANRPAAERASFMLRLHDVVLSRRSEILDLLQKEAGKSRADAFEEIVSLCQDARMLGRRGASYLRPLHFSGLVPGLIGTAVQRRPLGVVGVIAPWNYPLILTLGEILPALMAGNGAVVKPDPLTSQSCRLGLDLLAEAGLPAGLVRQIDGEASVGEALIDAVDYIVFTGSTGAGRAVGARAAHRLIGSTLELGGKNLMYVRADARLDHAVAGAVQGCFGNAGQLCLSVERLAVHRSVAAEFTDKLLVALERHTLGNGLDFGYRMGSQVSARQHAVVTSHVADAVERGARVLFGGKTRTDLGPWVHEPTIVTDLPTTATSFATETFGPLVSLVTVDSDAEALALGTDGGLTGSVWTADLAAARRIAADWPVGSVTINECYVGLWGSAHLPFGGVGNAGLGRRHGAVGVQCLTRPQAIVTNRAGRLGTGLNTLLSQPPASYSALLTGALRGMRKIGMS